MRQKYVLYALLVGVCLVWAANMLAPIFRPEFKPPAELNGGFTFIAAALVGAIAKSNGDKDDHNHPSSGTGSGDGNA